MQVKEWDEFRFWLGKVVPRRRYTHAILYDDMRNLTTRKI